MKRSNEEKYLPITQSLKKIVDQTLQTKHFEFLRFYNQMEEAFTKTGFREKQQSGVKNILVMRLDAIGDFVLTTGFIRELRLNYPSARITLVVSNLVYPIAELCPYVNKVVAFDSKFNTSDVVMMINRITKIAAEELWPNHFDMAFSVQWGSENLLPLMMEYLSGARERIGYGYKIELLHFDQLPPKDKDINYLLLTKPVINPKTLIHEAAKHFYPLEAMALPVRSKEMELWYGDEDFQNARQLLSSIDSAVMKIVVGIGAGGGSRKYSVDSYISAFKSIVKSNGGKVRFIIIGGKAEVEDAEKFQNNLPYDCVLNLVEKTTLRETMAIIALSDLFIGNDTGVMHMAAAAKVPIIAVYRQPRDKDHIVPGVFSEYERFAPWQALAVVLRPEHTLGDCKNAMVYGGCKEPTAHCINQVKPEEVVEAFEKLSYIMVSGRYGQ